MYTERELKERIENLDAAIASGVTSVSVDGTQTSVSLSEMRMERDRLQDMLTASKRRRPATGTIHLGGF